jgi:vesicle coat complex subunit
MNTSENNSSNGKGSMNMNNQLTKEQMETLLNNPDFLASVLIKLAKYGAEEKINTDMSQNNLPAITDQISQAGSFIADTIDSLGNRLSGGCNKLQQGSNQVAQDLSNCISNTGIGAANLLGTVVGGAVTLALDIVTLGIGTISSVIRGK